MHMNVILLNIYRYAHECDPPEWKERGTGDIRILKHIEKNTCRNVMRQLGTIFHPNVIKLLI